MDFHESRSGSPTPLQAVSPERVNQQQGNQLGFGSSIASVTDKISQFNSLAMQSKQLERKTADAALKRAMLGREEAETDMRRYREEARQLRKQIDEGRHREQRVGERLEAVMENYGRAKETHAHTQALWEKEIRRARKETFKSQSAIVKLQEELKTARASARASEETLVHEKERSKAREQEAFQARYELVGCQEELEQTLQKVKILEQERDAFRSLAKSEEDVARIASEGRLPLPPPDPEEEAEEELEEKEGKGEGEEMEEDTPRSDEDSMAEDGDAADTLLAIPKQRSNKRKSIKSARISSAALLDIKSSAASEAEIGELTRLWQWEKQRADRASDLVEYLEAECHLRACSCMKKRPRTSILESARKRPNLDIGDGGDRIILSEMAAIASPTAKIRAIFAPATKQAQQSNTNASDSPRHQHDDKEEAEETVEDQQDCKAHEQSPKQKPPRLSTTIFIPSEGVFRTVSQQIAEEMEEAVAAAAVATMAAMPEEPSEEAVEAVAEATHAPTLEVAAPTAEPTSQHAITHTHTLTMVPHHEILDEDIQDADTTLGDVTTDTADYTVETTTEQSMYARTPSVDPPSFAQQRTSLLSLLDAPHRQEAEQPINFYVPTTSGLEMPVSASTRDITAVRDFDTHSNADMDVSMEEMPSRAAASMLISSTSMQDAGTDTETVAYITDIHDAVCHEAVVDMEQEESRVSDATEVAYSRSSQSAHGRSASAQAPRSNDVGLNYEDRDATPQAQPQRYETPVMEEALIARSVRPHTVAATNVFSHKTTTTKVPLREETTDPSLAQRIMAAQRTPPNKILPSSSSASAIYGDGEAKATDGPSFDINNPALTPTMTREECLAQIRERRGRARSAAGGSTSSSSTASSSGTATTAPGGIRRPVTPGKERREVSAPVRRVASVRRVRP
ncbi:hypothetical protein SCUCBS95973_007578 [Sporothrix curviconia]|uniref:Uncharacterized protein n=1 Tax=Sporothrix curviconia TaxID=1260050 RepID=A0ABP0CH47_9PEZI